MANKPNGNKEAIIQIEELAFKLRAKGWSQVKIAKQLNMTQQGISKALKRITKRFSQCFHQDVIYIKYEQVAQLEEIAHEAMMSWHKSKEGFKFKRGRLRQPFGDPRFLMVFMKAKEDIRKTLGIYDFKEECESDDIVTEIQIVHIGSDGEIKKIN